MIINTQEQYQSLLSKAQIYPFIFVCVNEHRNKHHIINNILCAGVYFLHDKSFYLVNNTHSDAPKFRVELILSVSNQTVYVENKKNLNCSDNKIIDLSSLSYVHNLPIIQLDDFLSSIMTFYDNVINLSKNLTNSIIPLVKWYDVLKTYVEEVEKSVVNLDKNNTFEFYNNIVVPTIMDLESPGLTIDPIILKEHFPNSEIENNKVYCNYNIFKTTGRPSNAFGTINFSALNKTDGSRKSFVSRFGTDGKLIQLDFDAYHLRLMMNQKNISINEPSVHEYLAKQYYKTDIITEEQYKNGKQQTFAILYGDDVDESAPDLLKTIKMIEKRVWQYHQDNGYILTPHGRKIVVDSPKPNKVFNYMIQAMEFERTISRIYEVVEFLRQYKTKVILYTYDAILLDCYLPERDTVVDSVRLILEEGKFPVSISEGNSYHEIQ
jgi:hypothetical protein